MKWIIKNGYWLNGWEGIEMTEQDISDLISDMVPSTNPDIGYVTKIIPNMGERKGFTVSYDKLTGEIKVF